MQLAVTAHLPAGSRVWLEAPVALVDAMNERSPFVQTDEPRGVGFIPVSPHGPWPLGTATFPARARFSLRLVVEIPSEFRGRVYTVSVSQRHEGMEVGRVSWQVGKRAGRPARVRAH